MPYIFYILFFTFCCLQPTTAQLSVDSLDSLAKTAYYEENYNKALHYYQQMLQQIEEQKNIASHLEKIKYIALLHLELGQYENAENLYLQIIQTQKELNKTENLLQIQCLGQLAYSYFGMGRYDEAESFYLDALTLGKHLLEEYAPTNKDNLNNLALLYYTIGRYEEAEQIYRQVLELDKRNMHTKQDYATSLNNLATLYHKTNRYAEAKKLYLESQELRKYIYGEDHPNYALGLNNLAALYESMYLNEDAEQLYIQAREILGKDNPNYVHSLNSSAKLYYNQQKYAQAEKYWLEAKSLTQKNLGSEHPAFAQSLDNLALLNLKMNRLDTAWNYCLEGFAANSKDLDQVINWTKLENYTYYSNERASESTTTLLAISKAIYEQSPNEENLQRVYKISKMGMHINERIRNEFSSSNNKLKALNQNNNFAFNGIKAIVNLNNKTLFAEAFVFAEQNKSMLLLDAIKGQRARALGDLPDSLALLELNLQHQKENLQQAQYKAESQSDKAFFAEKLNELNLEIDAFVKSIKNKYPQYHKLKYASSQTNLRFIQQQLEDKTLLLEYFIGKEQSYLFVVSKNDINVITINIPKTKLDEKIQALRDALSNYAKLVTAPEEAYIAFTKTADWMYKELLQKALENQLANRLVIITDGELGHIPFEVFLMTTAPQGKTDYNKLDYLIKKYSISYNYATSLWIENLNSAQKQLKKESKRQILGFAASYDKPNNNLLSLRSKAIFELRNTLDNLPAAQEEISTLSKSFKGQFLIGEDANEANFKQLANQYSVIHLAMHGVLNREHPALSSLAFSEDLHRREDNFLQAYEISQLQLNNDLVILSACETGYGQFEQGEGIMSLARSFMYAGVPSLVVSLWQVNDQATAVVMSLFYKNLAKKLPKDEALRQAKLNYLETYTGPATHPALWSAFIQLGNNQPILLETKNRWLLPLLIGLGLSLLIFALWKRKQNSKSIKKLKTSQSKQN